jgi:DegV family protein with EDD domain
MAPVAVVADTTHYMPREVVDEAGIHTVSLYVNQGGVATRESDMPDFDAFYEGLRTASELPKTSQPSIGDFLEVYEPLIEAGNDIVSVHLAAGISGTCEAARTAAAEIASRRGQRQIAVVDSRSAAAGVGAVALAAAGAARGGGDVDQVVARAERAVTAVKIWFAVDTLEYLQRGGRIGRAQAWVGGALKIKPILSLVDDQVSPIERVRTERRAFERMVDYLRARHEDGADGWFVQHIRAPEQAEALVAAGREIFLSDPLFVSEVGAVLGVHAGPGMIGVGGLPSALLSPRL